MQTRPAISTASNVANFQRTQTRFFYLFGKLASTPGCVVIRMGVFSASTAFDVLQREIARPASAERASTGAVDDDTPR